MCHDNGVPSQQIVIDEVASFTTVKQYEIRKYFSYFIHLKYLVAAKYFSYFLPALLNISPL